jgi:lipopolysaccharide transport system permease protein
MTANNSQSKTMLDDLPTTVVEPVHGWVPLQLGEVWEYRELLYFLVWRDIKVRYKQTVIGVAWAILQPLFTMVIFSLLFGGLANMPSDNIPYPIFSYSALLPWLFFANGLTNTTTSLVGSSGLVKKVYFPRLIIPISSVLTGLPDFGLSFLILLGMMLFYNVHPTLGSLLWLPVFLLLAFITSLGFGLWLAALNARYRDIRYLMSFIIQFWMFATPVIYPASLLNSSLRTLYALNPMVGVIEGFRWSLLGSGQEPGAMFFVSGAAALFVLVTGAFYFRRMEKTFADVI